MNWIWNQLFGQQWIGVSNLSNLTVVAVVPALWHKVTCDAHPTCWRLKHTELRVPGTTYHTCRRHATVDHAIRLAAQHRRRHPDAHQMLAPTRRHRSKET